MKPTHFAGGRLRMGLFVTLAAGLLAFVVLLATGCGEEANTSKASAAVADTGGRLQVTETYFDFGAVPVGQQVEHKFELKNSGTGPLNLGQMSVKRLEGC